VRPLRWQAVVTPNAESVVGQALDQTQAIALRTAALVDGFEERLARLIRRVEALERQNERLRRALHANDSLGAS
jgi:hypothetical protein